MVAKCAAAAAAVGYKHSDFGVELVGSVVAGSWGTDGPNAGDCTEAVGD